MYSSRSGCSPCNACLVSAAARRKERNLHSLHRLGQGHGTLNGTHTQQSVSGLALWYPPPCPHGGETPGRERENITTQTHTLTHIQNSLGEAHLDRTGWDRKGLDRIGNDRIGPGRILSMLARGHLWVDACNHDNHSTNYAANDTSGKRGDTQRDNRAQNRAHIGPSRGPCRAL